jgi:hypothetical protein
MPNSNIPMLAPFNSSPTLPVTCGGFSSQSQRQYSGSPGTLISVAVADDVTQLQGRGWTALPNSGTTAQRPTSLGGSPLPTPTFYIDSTISKTIVWDGANWRDVTTGGIV